MNTRADHRRSLRDKRRGLSLRQRRDAAQRVSRLSVLPALFARRQRIAFYLANDGELDPQPLMERLRGAGRRCYLPVLNTHRRRPMRFAPYTPGMPMAANRFSIPEPVVVPRAWLPAERLDLIIMPLVGFDRDGNRLGMGGGFYDRTLSFLRHRGAWRRPFLLGLAYEFQCLDQVESRPWDVPLDGVVTERCLRFFR